jgi:hypothetical protein
MHATLIFAALTLLPGLDPPSSAQTVPYDALITVPEAEVRSGPSSSEDFYPTSQLHRGDRVRVVEEKGDWLVIEPPLGSFSFIQDRIIKPNEDGITAAVGTTEAWVRVGSILDKKKMNVQHLKVKEGTQVVILDKNPIYADDGVWIKIQPPPGDYRFIPASAVKPSPQVPAVSPAQPASTPVSIARPEVASPQAATGDSLWYQAEQAERAGNPAEAERLFAKLANETGDHDLKIRCYNRIHFLREGRRPSYPPGYQPGRPNEAYYPNVAGQSRLYPTSANPYGQPGSPYTLTGRASSQYTYTREIPVTAAGQVGPVGYGQNPAPVPSCQWSGWGWLRRAPFFVDNKPAFVLENSQGLPRLYVTAQAGVSLESYVNRSVNLYGKMTYRGDLRTNYMTACRLTPLP